MKKFIISLLLLAVMFTTAKAQVAMTGLNQVSELNEYTMTTICPEEYYNLMFGDLKGSPKSVYIVYPNMYNPFTSVSSDLSDLYEFNADGKVVRKVNDHLVQHMDKKPQNEITTTTFKYDANGKAVERTTKQGTYPEETHAVAPNNKYLVGEGRIAMVNKEKTGFIAKGNINISYNPNGTIRKIYFYSADEMDGESGVWNYYTSIDYVYAGDSKTITSITSRTSTTEGLKVKKLIAQTKYDFEYELDDKGNWTTLTVKDSENKVTRIKREVRY